MPPHTGPTSDQLARETIQTAERLVELASMLRHRDVAEVDRALSRIMDERPDETFDFLFSAQALKRSWLHARMARMVRMPIEVELSRDGSAGNNYSRWTVALKWGGSRVEFAEDCIEEELHLDAAAYAEAIPMIKSDDPALAFDAARQKPEMRTPAGEIALDRAFVALSNFVEHAVDYAQLAQKEGSLRLDPIEMKLARAAAPIAAEMMRPP